MKKVQLTKTAKNLLAQYDVVLFAYYGATKGINFNFVLNLVADIWEEEKIVDDWSNVLNSGYYPNLFDDLEIISICKDDPRTIIDILPYCDHIGIWIFQERLDEKEVEDCKIQRELVGSK